MQVNGTLINYYFHCKRQCYLHGNRLNLEDNSEQVKIGKAIHEEKAADKSNSEIAIDVEAAKWQLLYYLKVLKNKGIVRKGKLEFVEKNKSDKKVMILELTEELENELDGYVNEIQELIASDKPPEILNSSMCKKCAYYEYCYV